MAAGGSYLYGALGGFLAKYFCHVKLYILSELFFFLVSNGPQKIFTQEKSGYFGKVFYSVHVYAFNNSCLACGFCWNKHILKSLFFRKKRHKYGPFCVAKLAV